MDWIKIFEEDFVREFLKKVFKNSFNITKRICERVGNDKIDYRTGVFEDREWFEILIQFIYFYLFLTEKYANDYLDKELRREFIPALEEVTLGFAIDIIFDDFSEKKNKDLGIICRAALNKFKHELKHFNKLIPTKNSELKNSLFGKFTERIIGYFKEDKAKISKLLRKLLIESLKDIDFYTFINEFNNLEK